MRENKTIWAELLSDDSRGRLNAENHHSERKLSKASSLGCAPSRVTIEHLWYTHVHAYIIARTKAFW